MVKQVPLSRGLVALVDDGDHDRVLAAGPWHAAPGHRTVYARRNLKIGGVWATTESLHGFLTGYSFVDHIDTDGLNNQRSNLRESSHRSNAANRPTRRDSASGMKGVSRVGRRWRAQINVNGQKIHLGMHGSISEAGSAYDSAARQHFGEFARLNFPTEGEQAA